MKRNKWWKLPFLAIVAGVLFSCGGTYQLLIISSEETNLGSLQKITDDEDYKFGSPFGGDNGKDLFFAALDKRGRSNIYYKENPVVAAMSPKTDGNNFNITPSYCPKTKMLAFSGRQLGSTVSDISMLDVSQGVALRRLTNTPSELERYPCISTDGRFIVYEKGYIGGVMGDIQIWRQDLETESTTMICKGRMPSLSHDGRSIVFTRYASDGNNTVLVLMDVNGKNQTVLTNANMGYVATPRFSPNDKQIVFQCQKRDKKDFDLYVINRDGTGLTQLTYNKSYDADPYWSTDGYIYFSSDRGGIPDNFQIWRFQYGEANTFTSLSGEDDSRSNTSIDRPNSVPAPASTPVYHTVQQDETITTIAKRYNVTVRDIVKWNSLTTMTITPGMRLKVGMR